MALHVIVGKGPVGSTTAEELVARGHSVRVLSRSGGDSTDAVEHRRVDAADAGALFLIAKPFNEETFQDALEGVIA